MTALAVPIFVDLDMLANFLAVDVRDLEATTYMNEISGLFPLGDRRLVSSQLCKKAPRFRLCPRCFADDHLIRRTAALEGISHCVVHQVKFADHCTCGHELEPFPVGGIRKADPSKVLYDPYTCEHCRRHWESLPCEDGDEATLNQEQPLLEMYAALLTTESEGLFDRALDLFDHDLPEKNSWADRGTHVIRESNRRAFFSHVTLPSGATEVTISVVSLARLLLKHGFTSHCLRPDYFATCHQRYIREYDYRGPEGPVIINVPESELDQPCPCGNQAWRQHIVSWP